MLAISLGLPALKSKSAKDRQTYQVAWLGAETLACVELPVFGKQISCRFGGTPKWPLTRNDVMKPPSFCWRSHATSAVRRKWKRVMWLRPTSLLKEIIWPRPLRELGNWGQTWFEYSNNAWEISAERCTPGGIKDVKTVSFDVYIVLMWDWGCFFGFCQ